MTKQMLYRIAISALFLVFGGLPVSAQSQDFLMSIEIPFDFQVGTRVLPAGKYVVKRDQRMPQILMLQCNRKKVSEIIHTTPHDLSRQAVKTSLLFTNYSGQHFLTEVRVPDRGEGYAVAKSKTERKLAQAIQTAEPKTVRATNNSTANN